MTLVSETIQLLELPCPFVRYSVTEKYRIMYTCIVDTCTMDTCIMGTYIMDTCIMDTCIMDTCIMDTSAWVTRPERLKGAKDEVKEAGGATD